MTLLRSATGANSFATKDSLNLAPLPPHDEVLSPDTLGTLSLNFEWRKIIVPAILAYYALDDSEISLDNYDLLMALLEDLYA